MVSFALFKDVSCSKEGLIKKIGLDDNIVERIPFKCHNAMGEEITSTASGTDNQKTTIIFEEDGDYYLFELLFASKNCYDQHVVKQMEDMARESISLKGEVVWMCGQSFPTRNEENKDK